MDIAQIIGARLGDPAWLLPRTAQEAAKGDSSGSPGASASFADTLKSLLGFTIGNRSLLSTLQGSGAGGYESALLDALDASDADGGGEGFGILHSANSRNGHLTMLAALKGIQDRNPTAASVFGSLLQGADGLDGAADPFKPDASRDESLARSEDALLEALLKPNPTGNGHLNALQALVRL